MTQLRASVLIAAGTSASWTDAAVRVEGLGLGTVWIGDPDPAARLRSHEAYLVATAGAIAARTVSLRIGLFLTIGDGGRALRIAEDLAVLDNVSAGRIEYGVVPAPADGWEKRALALEAAWRGWRMPDGAIVPVLPHPLQPAIPCLLAGEPHDDNFVHAGAGRLFGVQGDDVMRRRWHRKVLLVAFCGADAGRLVEDIRARAGRIDADEVMISCDGSPDALAAIARDVAPLLRMNG